MTSFLSKQRAGHRPTTTPTNPHAQLDQQAPRHLQEKVFNFARDLPGVMTGPSAISVPGARAFSLTEGGRALHGSFMIDREFAHLHPPRDGSLHMTLPPDLIAAVIENGWAERHPLAGEGGIPYNIVMVYGPRDEEELAVVEDLIRASHGYARG